MTQKKSYSRYFIILQEDERGYALASDKLPSGYAKLEMKNEKCKISYYVQNLRKESAPYYMMLICNKKEINKIIKLGELNIDEHGRAEVSYEYEVDSICNTGISMDKIVGAAICRLVDSNVMSIMCGFASTDIPEWKKFNIVAETSEKETVEVKEEVKSIFDKYEEDIENEKNIKDEQLEVPDVLNESEPVEDTDEIVNIEIKEEIEDIQEPINEDMMDRPIDEVNVEDPLDEIRVEEENTLNDVEEEFRHKSKKKGMDDFFKDIAKDFEEVDDICSEIKRCKWHKVNVKCLEGIEHGSDYNKCNVIYYPMVSYYSYINKYGHYLLGYKRDLENKMKYLVYAIPGCNCQIDQPFAGRTGFVTWVPGKRGQEYFGYWIMFYDFKTSTIVIPAK